MIRAVAHMLLLAGLAAPTAQPALAWSAAHPPAAEDSPEAAEARAWNETRAGLFADVCMGSAPGFEGFAEAAAAAGFAEEDGKLVYPPEVVLRLIPGAADCLCAMTMGAPDPDALAATVFGRLMDDYGSHWRPTSAQGSLYDTYFERDGKLVRVMQRPEEISGGTWLSGLVAVPGRCPE